MSQPDVPLAYEVPGELQPNSLAVTLGTVGVKLIGVYLLAVAIASVPQVIYLLSFLWTNGAAGAGMPRYYPLIYLGTPLAYALLGGWLLVKGARISVRLFDRVAAQDGEPVNTGQLAALLIAAAGLLTFTLSITTSVTTIVTLAGNGFRLPNGSVVRSSTALVDPGAIASVLAALAQPALGLLLVFRAATIARAGTRRILR